MARVRKTSSDSPRARAETTAQIPLSVIVGAFDTAVTTRELDDDDEHRLLVAITRDLEASQVGSEFDPRRVLGLTDGQRAAWCRRRRKWIAKLLKDDPRVDASS